MLARSRALSYIAALATIGCNLDNRGDPPPRGLLYFPNALALGPHDAGKAAEQLLLANSDFDLRYRTGTLQSYSLTALDSARSDGRCMAPGMGPGPDCLVDASESFINEAGIGAFSTAVAVSSDGGAVFVATRTDDTLGVVGLEPDGHITACGGEACPARVQADGFSRNGALAFPSNPVAISVVPVKRWVGQDSAVSGDFVVVAHRVGTVSLFVYQPGKVGDAPGDLVLIDVLDGFPQVLTEMAFDPRSALFHLSVAGGSSTKELGRAGIVLPADATSPLSARLFSAGAMQLDGVASGNDVRDLTFVAAVADSGAPIADERALLLSTYPSAMLVVDASPATTSPRLLHVESTVEIGTGGSRIITGQIGGRTLAIIACFDARQIFVIDLATLVVRSVVPNLSGPFDLALDEVRKLLYVADFRSSVVRVINLAPAVDDTSAHGEPVRVVATLGQPQLLPELQ